MSKYLQNIEKDCYGSQVISREVFFVSGAQRSHRKPGGCGAKRRFLPFLCIAKPVTGNGVNSNKGPGYRRTGIPFSARYLFSSLISSSL